MLGVKSNRFSIQKFVFLFEINFFFILLCSFYVINFQLL